MQPLQLLLWLVFTWYIFFLAFTLNLWLFLKLMCVSCRQNIVRSCFLIQFDNMCLWLDGLIHIHLMLLLVWLNLQLSFYLFFCFMSCFSFHLYCFFILTEYVLRNILIHLMNFPLYSFENIVLYMSLYLAISFLGHPVNFF